MPSVAAGHTVWPGAPGQPSFAIPSEMRRAGSPMISAASAISSISGRSGSASENSGAMRHFSAHKMRVRTWVLRELLNSRSEEHTSELQSRFDLVCRLLLEKKKKLDKFLSFREFFLRERTGQPLRQLHLPLRHRAPVICPPPSHQTITPRSGSRLSGFLLPD